MGNIVVTGVLAGARENSIWELGHEGEVILIEVEDIVVLFPERVAGAFSLAVIPHAQLVLVLVLAGDKKRRADPSGELESAKLGYHEHAMERVDTCQSFLT